MQKPFTFNTNNMFNLIIGIAVGAAFAPFWIKCWNFAKEKFQSYTSK